jgi:AraC-like DNA-binding protein
VTSPPELQRKYGFWIINASEDGHFFLPYEKCAERYFEFFSLSHLFDGGGKCWFANGNEEELVPGDWVLVAPGDIHRYGAWNGKAYVEDAIRFCGPVADRMRDVGILKSGIIHGSRMRKLLPIIALCQDPSVSAQINANISLQSLLVELYNMRESGAGGSPLMSQLLEELKQKPEHWWTVRELAEYCQLSPDQFRRNFQRYTGIPPKQYIEDLKLRQAAQLLLTCDLSVAEIAAKTVPSILVPYPFATADHQTTNAHLLVDEGAATLVTDAEIDAPVFADTLFELLDDADKRTQMREAAYKLGQDRAAAALADQVELIAR